MGLFNREEKTDYSVPLFERMAVKNEASQRQFADTYIDPAIKNNLGYESPRMKMKAITKDVDLSDGKAVQEVFMQLQAINPREASSWLSSVKPIINQHIEQQKMSATSSKPNTAQERFLDDKQASLLQRNFNVTTVEGLENFIRTATERYGLGHTTVVNKASTNLTTLQAGDRANTRAAELARLRELKADQDLKDTQTAMTVTEKTAVSQYVNVLKGLDVKGDTLLPQGKNEEPIEVAKTLGHFLHSYQKRLQTRKYDKASVKPSEVSKYFTPLLKAFKDIYDNGSVSWGIDKPSYFNAENATAMLDKILGVDGASLSEDERALLIQAGVPVRAPDAAPQIDEKEIVENNMVISDALQAHIRKLIKDGNRKQLREDESNGLYTRAMFEYVLGQGQ
jgi:hypothetical protein